MSSLCVVFPQELTCARRNRVEESLKKSEVCSLDDGEVGVEAGAVFARLTPGLCVVVQVNTAQGKC